MGNETLADVSTWADEVRNQAAYRETGSWHYINLSLGMNYEQFKSKVESMQTMNVSVALAQQEQIIKDKAAS